MRLHFDFSEYEDEPDGRHVVLTVTCPDGTGHYEVTSIYEKAVSMLYQYDINSNIKFSLGDSDE